MIDSIASADAIAGSGLSDAPRTQQLPAAPTALETVRFEQVVDSVAPQVESRPLLQLKGPDAAGMRSDVGQELFRKLAEVDHGFRKVYGRVMNLPEFESYVERHRLMANSAAPSLSAPVSTPVSAAQPAGDQNPGVPHYGDLMKEASAQFAASMEYTRDSTRWFMNTEMWLSKVRLLTSAITQLSTGLKTLFRAGGG